MLHGIVSSSSEVALSRAIDWGRKRERVGRRTCGWVNATVSRGKSDSGGLRTFAEGVTGWAQVDQNINSKGPWDDMLLYLSGMLQYVGSTQRAIRLLTQPQV